MASVLVGLAEVADVTTMTNRTFAITAKKEGYTGIVLVDENNRQFAELIVNVAPGNMSGRRVASVITFEKDKRVEHSYRCEKSASGSCIFDQSKGNIDPPPIISTGPIITTAPISQQQR